MSVGPNEFLLNGNMWLPNNPLSCEKFKYAYPPPVPEPLPDPVPDLNLLPEKSAVTEMGDAVCFRYPPIPQDKNVRIARNEMQHVPGYAVCFPYTPIPQDKNVRIARNEMQHVPGDAVCFPYTPIPQDKNVRIARNEMQHVPGDAVCFPYTPIPQDKNVRMSRNEMQHVPEKSAMTEMGDAVCFPYTPIPQDKNVRMSRNEMQHVPEKSAMTETGDAVCFPCTPIPQDKNVGISRNEMQHVPEDVGGISLPKEIPVIDLTNTPDEKPKRKKHVPKVLKEGKTSRKPATPKPVTPKPPRNTETPSGKRKYVRKAKPSEHMDAPSCPLNGNVVQANTNETASVRRRLSFEFGQNQAKDGQQLPPVIGQKVQMENQPMEPIFDLNSSPNEVIRNPQMPTLLCQPSRRETIIQNHMLNGHVGAVKQFPLPLQKSRREIVHDTLKKFAQNFRNKREAGHPDMSLQSGMTDSTRRGTKRSHSIVDENLFPRYANDIQAYYGSRYISEIPETSRYSSYVVESRKRSKEENRQNERTSSSLPLNRTPSSLRTSPVVPNNYQVYSFADEERPTMTNQTMGLVVRNNRQVLSYEDQRKPLFLEKTRTQNMMSFDQRDVVMTKVPVQANSLTSQNMIRDYNLSTPKKSAEFGSTNCGHLSTAEKGYERNNRQEIEIYRPPSRTGSHETNGHGKKKPRKYKRKGKIMPLDFSSDPLDFIVRKLNLLNLNGGNETVKATIQNAIVPYGIRDGTIVPYVAPTKKRRLKIRVLLDPETTRVWNVLMGKESNDEKIDMEKAKYWEEERRIFFGRVSSFTAKMNHIQGDRRFSRWKGSVVDSVVGVFLTQNVADHLSSSAYMTLAARFPLRSNSDNSEPSAEKVSSSTEERESCIIDSDDSIKCPEAMLAQELCSQGLPLNTEQERSSEKEMSNSNVVSSQNSEYLVETADDNPMSFLPDIWGGMSNGLCRQDSLLNTEHEQTSEKEMANSNFVSPQNSEYFETADHNPMSFLPDICGGMSNEYDSPTSFMELLQMAETTGFGFHGLSSSARSGVSSTDSCGGAEQLTCLGVDRTPYALGTNFQHDDTHNHLMGVPYVSSSFSDLQSMSIGLLAEGNAPNQIGVIHKECGAFANNIQITDRQCSTSVENSTESTTTRRSAFDFYIPGSNTSVQPITSPESEIRVGNTSFSPGNLRGENAVGSTGSNSPDNFCYLQDELIPELQQKESEMVSQTKIFEQAVRSEVQMQSSGMPQTSLNSPKNSRETFNAVEAQKAKIKIEPDSIEEGSAARSKSAPKKSKVKPGSEKTDTRDWDALRKQACPGGVRKERSRATMDSVDWEAVRAADEKEIAETIKKRGMSNMLANRIKIFLNRVVNDHGSIDLEWLRDIPPDEAKNYLLSMKGLGLKSVECIRLLTLHHLAFPVDVNVSRIIVRLGWVPLEPLPALLQFHGLEVYPTLDSVQKYIWPRLCKLDQRALYELHYHLITFGKVFCTKQRPNCSACPMKAECKHYASAYASGRLALPAPEEKRIVQSTAPIAFESDRNIVFNAMPLPQLEGPAFSQENKNTNNGEPIIEEPKTPEPEPPSEEILQRDIEDAFDGEDPDEIPFIDLIPQDLKNYLKEHNLEDQVGDITKALVALAPGAALKPPPKLKRVSRLRTEHYVYQLPDSHELLKNLDPREPDDPCSYFLAIWTPGETAKSAEQPQYCCNSRDSGTLCDQKTCFGCNSEREAQAQTVRGTILIPTRTAMRGSFPLNGTYFQVNEVFADHHTSCHPINVPRKWLGHLPRKTIYFGTSVPSIFKGLTTEEIQHCFQDGYVCLRGFDLKTRAPRPLQVRFHMPASSRKNGKPVVEEDE